MYLPEFVLQQREKEILASKLTRRILLKEFNQPLHVYVVDRNTFEEIANFTQNFRESLNEKDNTRPQVLRAVTQIVNTMSDIQKIKDDDVKTAAGASILSAIMSLYTIAPEYGNRLIGMFKSKV